MSHRPGPPDDARLTAERVAREGYGKLVAFLAARTRDVAAAEDALADAFAAALAAWPAEGVPRVPEAWLLTVARRKLTDRARRERTGAAVAAELEILADGMASGEVAAIPDERLALMFAAAHPAIEAGARAPLMLQVVLGLDAATIAGAFLASPAAMGKRLVRAKERIRRAGIPFRVPERSELPARLGAVLDTIYAAYSEGWGDPAGTDSARRGLAGEALHLAGVVVSLMPDEPEALGLLALMLHAEARRAARRDAAGAYVPLAAQDPSLWDAAMIATAEALLLRAGSLGAIGRYQLEAAIQSAHVERCRTGRDTWPSIVRLYDALVSFTGSPVASINRAIALSEVNGPAAGLAALPSLEGEPRLAAYQPYFAAKAELYARAGARAEARSAFLSAIALAPDAAVRRFLQDRLAALTD